MTDDLPAREGSGDDPWALLAASDAERSKGTARRGAELAAAAVRAAERLGDDRAAAAGHSMLAWHQVRLGDLEHAVASGQHAVTRFAALGPSAARSMAYSNLSLAYDRAGLHSLAVSHAATALEMARTVQDVAAECWALIRLGTAADEADDEHGLDMLAQALDLARQLGMANTDVLFTALNNLSRRWVVEADRRVGDPARARAALLAALPLAEEAALLAWTDLMTGMAAANLGGVHRRLGHTLEARQHFDRALREAERGGYAGLARTVRLALASLDLEAEPSPAHQRALAALLDAPGEGTDPDLALQARRTLVQGCRAQGDTAAALEHMERLHQEVLAAQLHRRDLQTRLLFNHAELHQARHAAERARLAAELERMRADAEQQTAQRLALDRDLLEREVAARTLALRHATSVAEAASRAKSAFLSIVSHELRTPLNGLLGMLALATRRATDPRQAEQLATATVSARQLNALIDNILNYVAADAAAPGLPANVELRTLLALRADAARAKGLGIDLVGLDALPAHARVDAIRLGQILDALLDNAVKFSTPPEVSLEARWLEKADGPARLRLAVNDHGPGLAPALRQRLFHPFEPGDGSSTRVHGGLGLGLALAQRLAQSLGGELGVDARLPSGSSFWVEVPVLPPSAPWQAVPDGSTEP